MLIFFLLKCVISAPLPVTLPLPLCPPIGQSSCSQPSRPVAGACVSSAKWFFQSSLSLWCLGNEFPPVTLDFTSGLHWLLQGITKCLLTALSHWLNLYQLGSYRTNVIPFLCDVSPSSFSCLLGACLHPSLLFSEWALVSITLKVFQLELNILFQCGSVFKEIGTLREVFIECILCARYYSQCWRCSSEQMDRNLCPHQTYILGGFPGGAVVKNPSANAGNMGSSPGLGRSHMPRSN